MAPPSQIQIEPTSGAVGFTPPSAAGISAFPAVCDVVNAGARARLHYLQHLPLDETWEASPEAQRKLIHAQEDEIGEYEEGFSFLAEHSNSEIVSVEEAGYQGQLAVAKARLSNLKATAAAGVAKDIADLQTRLASSV